MRADGDDGASSGDDVDANVDSARAWGAATLPVQAPLGGALPSHPDLPRPDSLVRLVTQVELLAETLRPPRSRAEALPPVPAAAPGKG